MYAVQSAKGHLHHADKGSHNNPSLKPVTEAQQLSTSCASSTTRQFDGKTRNVIRTLRNLRDDLKRLYPQEVMPSTWMIKCLVFSCNPSQSLYAHWDDCVIGIMQRLANSTENAFLVRGTFFELDGVTPLFPNYELFGPQHANRFAKLAISHLKMQLGKDESAWATRAIR